MEHDPSAAFVRLFGDGTADAKARQARTRQKNSILDSLLDEVSRLQTSVSAPDRSRLATYLESVRDVERRIQKAVTFNLEDAVVRSARRRARYLRAARAFDVRSAVARVSGRRHARHHVHDRPRVQRTHLSRDRRARRASSDLASPARSAAHGEVREDQPLSRVAVFRISREAEDHSRRRWLAARSYGDHLRRRHERG